jgi:hypothetical protein
MQLEEERKQAAAAKAAAAAKKKGGKAGAAGKKDTKDEDEEKKVVEEKPTQAVKKDLDLFVPSEFKQALHEKVQRPFIFGPVEFKNLNAVEAEDPFRYDLARKYVEEQLIKSPYLHENICIHGFKVCVK